MRGISKLWPVDGLDRSGSQKVARSIQKNGFPVLHLGRVRRKFAALGALDRHRSFTHINRYFLAPGRDKMPGGAAPV
jgi:hypothetical protein